MAVGLFTRVKAKNAKKSAKGRGPKKQDLSLLTAKGCKLCPIATKCAKMKPRGHRRPLAYIVVDKPSKEDVRRGKVLSGPSGREFLKHVPMDYRAYTRLGVAVRNDKIADKVSPQVSACCKSHLIKDIEACKPKIVIASSYDALSALLPSPPGSGQQAWRGNPIRARIGNHECWIIPVMSHSLLTSLGKKRYLDCPADDWVKTTRWDIHNGFKIAKRDVPPNPENLDHLYDGLELITGSAGDLQKVKDFLLWAEDQPKLAVDIEGNELRVYGKKAKMLSIAIGDDTRVMSIALDHPGAKWTAADRAELHDLLTTFLQSNTTKIAHNLSFEMEWFASLHGQSSIRMSDWDCTMAQAYIIDCRSTLKGLNALCMMYFGFALKDQSPIQVEHLEDEPLIEVLKYNGLDTKYTYKLDAYQMARIHKLKLMMGYRMQVKRCVTIAMSQIKGVPVDQEIVIEQRAILKKKIGKLKKKIIKDSDVKLYEKTFGRFNPGSDQQCVKLLRDILKRPEGKRGKKYSSDEKTLKLVAEHVPVAEKILEFRKATKLCSTYYDNFLATNPEGQVWPDGKFHTSFNVVRTATGRLSSSKPNLQNVPVRGYGKGTRRVVAVRSGWVLAAFDYGQIEARIAGVMSKDKRYIKALWDRYDIHMGWAKKIARAYPKVLRRFDADSKKGKIKAFRGAVKNEMVFPAIYGSVMESLADNLGVPVHIMGPLFEEFWDEFAGIKRWQGRQIKFYEKHRYVKCLTGRRRYGPMNTNMILNSPVQGTASDIVIDGMDRLSERSYLECDPNLQPALNIHDDLTFILPKNRLDYYLETIALEMINVPFKWITVPLVVEAKIGPNWADMEEVAEFSSDTL